MKILVDKKALEIYMQYALCKCQDCQNRYVCDTEQEQCLNPKCELHTAEVMLEKALNAVTE